jgi:membrane associated rhomboid family serine protease
MARGRKQLFGDAQITRGALYLLFATAGLSLVFQLADDGVRATLAGSLLASADSLYRELKLWTLVTSPLLESSFVSLLFQGLMLWMFLPALERWWGMNRFLRFALFTSIAGVLGGTLVGLLLGGGHALDTVGGLRSFTFAGILAFGVLYAGHPVRFFGAIPMTGKQLAIGIIVFTFAFILIGQEWVEGGANVAAMLLAYAMTSSRGSPKLWWLKWKQARIRRRFGVMDGGKGPGGKSGKPWLN